MNTPVYNLKKEKVRDLPLSAAIFDRPAKPNFLHQLLLQYETNKRLGTSSTKTRKEVTGSTRKIYRQKGTGNARHGDIKAPVFVGGGTVFGPHPRSWYSKIPTEFRHEGLRQALSLKNRGGKLVIVDEFRLAQPKTKEAAAVLKKLGLASALVVLAEPDKTTVKSIRNIAATDVCSVGDLNAFNVMKHEHLVLTAGAVAKVEKWLKS